MTYKIKMFKTIGMGVLLFIASSSQVFAASEGKEKFQQLCASCHSESGKSTIAPHVFGVINHVKRAYPKKEDFVSTIVDWVANPQEELSLMPGAIKKFGLMPKLPYAESDVKLAAEYLYDYKAKAPKGYKEHFEKMHGNHH